MASKHQATGSNLSILNPTPKFLKGPSLLHHLIADASDDTALEYHDSNGLALQLSYRELHHRTSTLAATLHDLSHAPRQTPCIIPLLIPQSATLYITQIAILKSGAAFCPLNLDVPEERLKFILHDVSAHVVATVPEHAHRFDGIWGLKVLVLDRDGSVHRTGKTSKSSAGTESKSSVNGHPETSPGDVERSALPPCSPSDPAYIMYTSGSTGTPKAVCLSHQAVTQSLLAHDRFIPKFARFLQFANPTFDVSVFEIYFPLFRRATLVSCDRTYLLSDLPNIITSLNVDAAELTPSVVASLVRTRKSVPKLQTLLTIGEMLNPQTVREFAGSHEESSLLFGMYGPTEAAIHCTLQPSFMQSDTVNTIGVPLDTVSCFIIKPVEEGVSADDVQILPLGEVGELAVGGHQLADGYLNRPEQTKAVFVHHPEHGPLYRTGDKAKLTSEGRLECLGRISKGQVKLRGQRMELGEVEHAASKLAGVHAACASVIDGQLVLFCVADAAIVKSSDVEQSCRKWLPRFMVPNDILIMKDFPYLPSGKTDQKTLETSYQAQTNESPVDNASKSSGDRKLLALLKRLLDKNLRPSTNLGSAGLDSLKAIKLATELKKHGYPQLSAVDILMCPTPRDLDTLINKSFTSTNRKQKHLETAASVHEELRDLVQDMSQLSEVHGEIVNVMPCTPLQEAMLVETAKNPRAYCNSATLTIPANVDFDQVVKAFSLVAARHASLRSGFVDVDHPPCTFAQIEWSGLEESQLVKVSRLQPSFSIKDSKHLLRPLQLQYSLLGDVPHLLLQIHHALYDQWSLDILVDDLYRALKGNDIPQRPSFQPVSDKALQYRNSRSTRTSLGGFWREYLIDAKISKLPRLTGKSTNTSDMHVVQRQSSLHSSQLYRLAKRSGVSHSVPFQAVYAYLLGLYSGQSDFMIGTVFSGRTAAIEDIEDIFGPMLTTLPTRLSTDGMRKFKDVTRAMQSSNHRIMAHAEMPLLEVKKAVGFDAGTALFDSIFVWQGSPRESINQCEVQLKDTTDFVESDLILDIEPIDETYKMKMTYRTSILPERQVQFLLDQIDMIMQRISDLPEVRLDELFIDVHPQACLSVYNPHPRHFDCEDGLSGLFDEACRQHANDVALRFATDISAEGASVQVLTYAELNKRANRLAHLMLSEGLEPGSLVGVIMEKSRDLYVSILAVIKAGCGYLPIVPSTPKQRIAKIVQDATPSMILSGRSSASVLKELDVDQLFVLEDITLTNHSSYNPRVLADAADIAYAVYTSGTTGQPKGVLVTHENIVGNIHNLAQIYPAPGGSSLLQSCNQAFDVSVFEIFFTWSQGMCLCSASNDVLFRDLEHSIRQLGVTHLSMTPTVAALIKPDNVPNVKFLITAGEAVTSQVFRQWAGRGLYQGYGPSETTNICTVKPTVAQDDAINNIGSSFENTSTFVLPPSGGFAPLPRGALGELCFGGQQVFKGYQNMPDLTAGKIINHSKYGRIFRSGDLGRLGPDGTILIEGRTDTQRKVRGQRIELQEIVNCVLTVNGVADATVLVTGPAGGEKLVTFWIPQDLQENQYSIIDAHESLANDARKIKDELQANLPSYMIPAAFIPISALPMTSQSKVDNARLLEDYTELPMDYMEGVDEEELLDDQELSQTEVSLREVLSKTFTVPESSLHRNAALFGVGLDSLSAIRLAQGIKTALNVQIDVSAILKRPRLASLAEFIDSQSVNKPYTNGHASALENFMPRDRLNAVEKRCIESGLDVNRILPCTPLQEAMLSTSVGQQSTAYLNRTMLKTNADRGKLFQLWSAMKSRHDILRTIFVSTDDAKHPFLQVILNDFDLPWTVTGESTDADQLLAGKHAPTFNAVDSMTVPYRLLYCTTSAETRLVISMHHSLYDANAMSILLNDIETTFRGETLPAPAAFDGFLEHMLHQGHDDADAFFKNMLGDFQPKALPTISGRPAGYQAAEVKMTIGTAELQSLQKKHAVSLLALCQSAWAKTLSVLQDSTDLCFGNVVSGRTVPVDGIDRLVAPCFNTLPVRINLEDHENNIDVAKYLHQINLDTMVHQLTPLRRIQQKLASGKRLFDSLLLLQQPTQELDSRLWTFAGETGDMDFPCILEIIPQHDGFQVFLHYACNLLPDEETATSICTLFSDIFSSILRYPMSDAIDHTSLDRGNLDGILRSTETGTHDTHDSTTDDSKAWTPLEEEIRDAFLALSSLEAKAMKKNTTIYRMGLDSISAIQVAKRLRDNGRAVSAADILENPSVAELASFLAQANENTTKEKSTVDFDSFDEKHREAVLKIHSIDSPSVVSIRPCTSVQSGMLAAYLQSDGSQYFNHMSYDATFAKTPETLIKAWQSLAAAHPMLRTGFAEIEDSDHSFAMVTYTLGAIPALVKLNDSIPRREELQHEDGDAVRKELHLPAWRCHIWRDSEKIEMLLSIHHALYDAASLGSILNDLRRIIEGHNVEQSSAADDALSYIISSSRENVEQRDFWTARMRSAASTRFPNMHPVVPEVKGIIDISRPCSMSQSELEDLATDQGVSLQAVFQAAWAKLLAAYIGEDAVSFGIVHSGRISSETQGAVFPCINTLPLSCNASQEPKELLADLMSFNAAVQKHCYTPLSRIQRWCGLQNEALFDSIFAFQKPLTTQDGNRAWTLTHEKATVDYAVSIEVEHLPDDVLRLRTTFDSTVMPSDQAEMLLQQLESIALELLGQSPTEDGDLKTTAIVPAKDPIISTDITQLVEFVNRSVAKYPKRTALEFIASIEDDEVQSQSWTYADLDQKANQVAHLIQSRNSYTSNVVALCFDKCPEASFAFLGILKAGCSILAIDATAPMARKELILKDAEASAVLCSSSIAEELSGVEGVPVIDVQQELTQDVSSSSLGDIEKVSPESLSYILYTSGTTGTPKGCELTQDNAVQGLLAFQRLFEGRWTEKSVWLQFASYHFDVAILEHFWTWSVGMKLLCAPRDLVLEDVAGFIDRFQVTHLDLTPSLGRLLDPASVPSLHSGVFITGGEAVKPEMLRAWGPYGCLFNFYGPTECTIGVTTFPSVPSNGKASNIGWQFDNVGTCVLKPGSGELVLRGAIGELCIFGKLVGKGYLKRPDLTEDRFPYVSSIGERVYRTGDLVRLLHDNSFEFLGRADSQVKLRGQRLEIDEIVAVMRACNDIKDAVCIVARQEEQQKDQLVAFLSSSPDRKQAQPSVHQQKDIMQMIKQAKAACEVRLPGYMVPSHFIPVDFIPLSVNNKQDDKLLKQMFHGLNTATLQKLSSPANEQRELNDTEKAIVKALSATLSDDLANVRPDSNMFALGLSSISAVQLTKRLKSAGYAQTKITTVMQNATISKLATAISAQEGSSQMDASVLAAQQAIAACQQKYLGLVSKTLGCKTQDIERVAPCTPLQQGILYRSQSSSNGLYYNRFLFEADNVDVEKLHAAFQKLVDSVDILRAVFLQTEDGHIQTFLRSVEVPWKHYSAVSKDEALKLFEKSRRRWTSENYDILRQPMRVDIAQCSETTVVQISIHHVLYDGNSWGLMMQRVAGFYNGRTENAAASFLDALPYGPLHQVQGAQSFWGSHLTDAAPEPMQRLVESESFGDSVITKEITVGDNLDRVRRELQVTPQAIVQSAWLFTLAQYHSGPVGLVVSGRSLDIEADHVIGPLFNTIPFAWNLDEQDTWASLCKRSHAFNIDSLPYHHTPLRDISKWLRLNSKDAIFDSLFVFQQPAEGSSEAQFLRAVQDAHYTADYPLSFEAEQKTNGTLGITLGAQGHIADEATLGRIIGEFDQNLGKLLADCDSPLQLPNSYRSQIQTGSTKREQPSVNGYHGPFEWTASAKAVRAEMASLADVKEDDIDEHTAIFAIGLDSIDAVKLSARLKKHGMAVPVSVLMKSQTVPKILENVEHKISKADEQKNTDRLQARQAALEKAVRQSISNAEVEQILAATPMQEGLISEMIQTDYKAYFNHDVLELKDNIDLDRLDASWGAVITASPILRTAFIPVDDPTVESTIAQLVRKPGHFEIDRVTLDQLDTLERHLERVRSQMSQQDAMEPPFVLSFVEQEAKRYLTVSIAHAMYDGYSIGLLHRDVNDAYHDRLTPRPSYTGLVNKALDATGPQTESFWQGIMTDVKPSIINEAASDTGTTYRSERKSALSSKDVSKFCRSQGITAQVLCQTAWSARLAQLTKSLDVVFGLVLAGRDDADAEQVMFPTMNTVVMRSILHGTAADMLKDTQGRIIDMMPFQQTPLRRIQQIARQVGNKKGGPLFSTLFTYQKRPNASNDAWEPLYVSVDGSADVDYPIAIETEIMGEEVIWRVAVKSTVADQAGADQLLAQVDELMQRIVTAPTQGVLDVTNDGISVLGQSRFQAAADKKANGAPTTDGVDEADEDALSSTEIQIRDAVAQVGKIPVDEVQRNVRLENLGIDSISAIKLASMLKKQGLALPVSKIIKAGTVAEMAKLVGRMATAEDRSDSQEEDHASALIKRKGFTAEKLGLDAADVEAILPASAGQVYMLGTWINSKGKLFYPTFTYSLQGVEDSTAVQQAWQRLVSRHAILRTTFAATGQQDVPFVQIVHKPNTQADLLADLKIEESKSGLVLKLSIHHALYDAVSLHLLMSDLEQDLNSRPPTSSTTGFPSFLSSSLSPTSLSQQRTFWTSYLANVHPTPTSTSAQSLYTGPRTEVFSPSLLPLPSSSLARLRKAGITLQSALFASYAQQLASTLPPQNQANVLLGIYLANRTQHPTLASPTVNLLPVVARDPLRTSTVQLARQIQADLATISEGYAGTSLVDVYRWTGLSVDAFVNFVRLPEEDDAADDGGDEEGSGGKGQGVRLRNLDGESEMAARAKVKPAEPGTDGEREWEVPEALKGAEVEGVYPHSLDVEATVREGMLAVGVFGYEKRVGLEEAKAVVEGVRARLKDLFH